MTGFVYAIAADNGLIKIGFTTNLRARLSHIRCHNAFDVTPLGQMPGGRQDEKRIHERLALHRVHGEWFSRATEVLDLVGGFLPWPPSRKRGSQKRPSPTKPAAAGPSIFLRPLLAVVDAYETATLASDTTVSSRIFNDGKKIGSLRTGADIMTRKYNAALVWFSANWPEGAVWPEGVSRPGVEQAA